MKWSPTQSTIALDDHKVVDEQQTHTHTLPSEWPRMGRGEKRCRHFQSFYFVLATPGPAAQPTLRELASLSVETLVDSVEAPK